MMDNKKTPTEDTENTPLNQEDATCYKIGGTTYIVTRTFNPDAKEGLMDKLWRLIKNDAN